MALIDGRTWLEHLNPGECWELLAATPVGRVGVLADSAPEIYPVNHAVDRRTIVFRTDPGSKLRGLLRSPAVCYQIDGIDPADATGWSVLVKGRAVELHHPDELRAAAALPLRYWTLGDKAHWIRIVPDEVTGRRIWSRTAPFREAGPTDATDATRPTGATVDAHAGALEIVHRFNRAAGDWLEHGRPRVDRISSEDPPEAAR